MLKIIIILLGSITVRRRFYEENVLDTFLSDIQCTGAENQLLQCNSTMMPQACSPQQTDAGVVCQAITTERANCSDGDVRLVNGRNALEGRVEVCINSAWGTVCDSSFSEDEAIVTCNQLGFRVNGMFEEIF